MLQSLIFLLFLAIVLLAPVLAYRLKSRSLAFFCYRMLYLPSTRSAFFICVLSTEVGIHYLYHKAYTNDIAIMFSTVVFLACCNLHFLEKWVRLLRDNKRYMFWFFVATLAMALIPHMLTFALAFVIILIAACFYPSKRIRHSDKEYYLVCDDERNVREFDDIINDYFQ